MPTRIHAVQPVLGATDVVASLSFYARIGFACEFCDVPERPRYAAVQRDGIELHLQWHDAGDLPAGDRPTYRFVVDDVAVLHAEFTAAGVAQATKMTPVMDTAWGTREFHLHDPDRNGLQFCRAR
jgi:hypothetical protein